MSGDGSHYQPGTPVRVARLSAERAKLAVCGFSSHEHYGDVGRVTEVVDDAGDPKYVVRFDPYGDDQQTFEASELEPAPPRKT